MILPACSANKLLQEQLRERMGFKGIVITGTPPTGETENSSRPARQSTLACPRALTPVRIFAQTAVRLV